MSPSRPVGYCRIESVRRTRVRLAGAYLCASMGALAWLAGYEAWHVLMALMVMRALVR